MLNNITCGLAVKVIRIKTPSTEKNKKRYKKKWYDKDCNNLRLELNRLGKRISRDPLNVNMRNQYNKCRREYKKLLRGKEKNIV